MSLRLVGIGEASLKFDKLKLILRPQINQHMIGHQTLKVNFLINKILSWYASCSRSVVHVGVATRVWIKWLNWTQYLFGSWDFLRDKADFASRVIPRNLTFNFGDYLSFKVLSPQSRSRFLPPVQIHRSLHLLLPLLLSLKLFEGLRLIWFVWPCPDLLRGHKLILRGMLSLLLWVG